jgi:hypothetical protein
MVINMGIHFSHDHHETKKPYVYQTIRTKEFPWEECSACDLFDSDCFAKCRAAKA